MLAVFNDFYRTGSFVHLINTSVLVIIPKVVDVENIKDFRSISVVGSVCKLISKVLAKRMTKVLGEVIGENQNAFVEGRQIFDALMIVNEIVGANGGNGHELLFYNLFCCYGEWMSIDLQGLKMFSPR